MSTTLQQLADLVGGRVQGDSTLLLHRARPVNEAQAGDITFIEDAKNIGHLKQCLASAAVIHSSIEANGLPVIQAADPLAAFVAIAKHLRGRAEPTAIGIDQRASVHPTATIGPDSSIHPLAVIGEGSVLGARCTIHSGAVVGRFCRLGDDVTLFPNCVLYDDTVLGQRVIIHANAIIGADGYGYRLQGGRHVKVPQLGNVEIADDVEIGAGTAIDRGTFAPTRIGQGTKIDNMVQIGHNCQIGKHNLLVSQVGIAGSCSTGDYVVIAGQVGVADHVHIGEGALIGAKAGVSKNVPPGQRTLGVPAMEERETKRMVMSMFKLPDLIQDVKRIKKQMGMTEVAE